jgi:hypothetical protein
MMIDACLAGSFSWESRLVAPEARAAAARLADQAREELRRCLAARTLARRLWERPLHEIVLGLCQAGLCDHAAALVIDDWQEQGLAVV